MGESADVGIDNDAIIAAVGVSEDDVSGFSADAREGGEGLHLVWDTTVVFFDEGSGAGFEASRFGAEKAC